MIKKQNKKYCKLPFFYIYILTNDLLVFLRMVSAALRSLPEVGLCRRRLRGAPGLREWASVRSAGAAHRSSRRYSRCPSPRHSGGEGRGRGCGGTRPLWLEVQWASRAGGGAPERGPAARESHAGWRASAGVGTATPLRDGTTTASRARARRRRVCARGTASCAYEASKGGCVHWDGIRRTPPRRTEGNHLLELVFSRALLFRLRSS